MNDPSILFYRNKKTQGERDFKNRSEKRKLMLSRADFKITSQITATAHTHYETV